MTQKTKMDKRTKLFQQVRTLLQEKPTEKIYRRLFMVMKSCPVDVSGLYVDYILNHTRHWPEKARRMSLELEDLANAPRDCLRLTKSITIKTPKKFIQRWGKAHKKGVLLEYPDFDVDFGLPHTEELYLMVSTSPLFDVLLHNDTNPKILYFDSSWKEERALEVVQSCSNAETYTIHRNVMDSDGEPPPDRNGRRLNPPNHFLWKETFRCVDGLWKAVK
jgi:hypothetical protein